MAFLMTLTQKRPNNVILHVGTNDGSSVIHPKLSATY